MAPQSLVYFDPSRFRTGELETVLNYQPSSLGYVVGAPAPPLYPGGHVSRPQPGDPAYELPVWDDVLAYAEYWGQFSLPLIVDYEMFDRDDLRGLHMRAAIAELIRVAVPTLKVGLVFNVRDVPTDKIVIDHSDVMCGTLYAAANEPPGTPVPESWRRGAERVINTLERIAAGKPIWMIVSPQIAPAHQEPIHSHHFEFMLDYLAERGVIPLLWQTGIHRDEPLAGQPWFDRLVARKPSVRLS